MSKINLISIVILFISQISYSQYINIGAENMAMGQADVAYPSVWSSASNQAALPFLEEKYSVGLNYENYYFIKELSLKSLAFVYNSSKYGSFDLLINSFGYSLYNENFFNLGYSMKLAKNLAAGIQIDYVHYHLPQPYKNINLIVGEISLFSKISEDIFVGFHLYNPWLAKIKLNDKEYFPTIAELGMMYKNLDKLNFTFAIKKDLDYPFTFKTGINYQLIKNLYLRSGLQISQRDFFYSFGLGYEIKNHINLNLAFMQHPALGLRSGISLEVYL